MVTIDRHRMNCRGRGNILSMFHLQRSGSKMRYQYECCKLRNLGYCTLVHKYTPFNRDGNGNSVYLDRHSANCGTKSFVNDFRIERNSGHNKVRQLQLLLLQLEITMEQQNCLLHYIHWLVIRRKRQGLLLGPANRSMQFWVRIVVFQIAT